MSEVTVIPFCSEIKPSRIWLVWVFATHILLFFSLFIYLPSKLWLLMFFPLTFYCAFAPLGYFFNKNNLATRIQVDILGNVTMFFGPLIKAEKVELCSDSFISTWLIVFNIKINSKRRSVILLPDSANTEFLRNLRVYLRWFPLVDAHKNHFSK